MKTETIIRSVLVSVHEFPWVYWLAMEHMNQHINTFKNCIYWPSITCLHLLHSLVGLFQEQIQRDLLDMNILLSEKQTACKKDFKPENDMKLRHVVTRWLIKQELESYLTFTVIAYYEGGFQEAEDWLKVIIFYHFRKTT